MKRTIFAFLLLPVLLAMLALPLEHVGADIVIDLTTDTGDTSMPGATGDLLDVNNNAGEFPLNFDVVEDTVEGLELIVASVSSFDSVANPTDTVINAGASSFGVNSPTPTGSSEEPSRFDVDAEEVLEIGFNLDVFILNADFRSLSGSEAFNFGPVTINDGNTNGADLFDFTVGGTTPGFFLPAGSTIFLEAGGPAGSDVALESIEVEVAVTVPEPTSLALLGFGSVLMMARRRRR